MQAAIQANDLNTIIGMEGGRRIQELRRAGQDLQQQLQNSQQQVAAAADAVRNRDEEGLRLRDDLQLCEHSTHQVELVAENYIENIQNRYNAYTSQLQNECVQLKQAESEMYIQSERIVGTASVAYNESMTYKTDAQRFEQEAIFHRTEIARLEEVCGDEQRLRREKTNDNNKLRVELDA